MADGDTGKRPRPGGALADLPAAWVAVTMALALYGLVSGLPVLGVSDLPDGVRDYLYGSIAGEAVTVFWGGYVLAFFRSSRFAGLFTGWQWVQILWTAVRQLYVLVAPVFTFAPAALAFAAVHVAVGLFCLHVVRRPRHRAAPAVPAAPASPGMPALLAAALGTVAGAVLGFGAGLGTGVLLVELTGASCFEGACGYLAVFIGLLGLVAGGLAGGVVGALRFGRRAAAP